MFLGYFSLSCFFFLHQRCDLIMSTCHISIIEIRICLGGMILFTRSKLSHVDVVIFNASNLILVFFLSLIYQYSLFNNSNAFVQISIAFCIACISRVGLLFLNLTLQPRDGHMCLAIVIGCSLLLFLKDCSSIFYLLSMLFENKISTNI